MAKYWVMQSIDRGTYSEAFRVSGIFAKNGYIKTIDLAIDLCNLYPGLEFYATDGEPVDSEFIHAEKEYFIEVKTLSNLY